MVFFTTFDEHADVIDGNEVTFWLPSGTGLVAYLVAWLVSLAFSLWNRTFRQGTTGQSIGKKALGIRLVADPTAPTFGRPPAQPGSAPAPVGPLNAFLRDLAHVADGAAYVGYLWPLWDDKRQTFADKIMKTVVIDARWG